jgi:hypothetical protein
VFAHDGPQRPSFAGPVGSHLRHIVEHYEALLFAGQPGVIDYDSRPRCRELETQPAEAARRLGALRAKLADYPADGLDAPVQVLGLAGSAGEFAFAVPSSVARELVFVASHAIHHYALLAAHCQQHGIPIPADFGKAPATVAHERAQQQAAGITQPTIATLPKEKPCPALLLQA